MRPDPQGFREVVCAKLQRLGRLFESFHRLRGRRMRLLPCGTTPLGACDYAGSGDGTCLAPGFSWAAASPFCVAAGSRAEGAGCSLVSPQSVRLAVSTYLPTEEVTFIGPGSSSFCGPGLLCVDNGSGNETGKCRPSCNDQVQPGSCGSGTCYTLDPSGFGFCRGGSAAGSIPHF